MKYIKSFEKFLEDATANASISGMGAVVNAQPGTLPGTTGTEGSGDISVGLKTTKKRRKKGNASEVCDLRDLETNKDLL